MATLSTPGALTSFFCCRAPAGKLNFATTLSAYPQRSREGGDGRRSSDADTHFERFPSEIVQRRKRYSQVSCSSSATAPGRAPAEAQQDLPLGEMLKGIEIVGTDGGRVPAASLWTERRALVAWVRHFGCVLCQKHAAALSSRKGELDELGVALAIVGPGSADQAKQFAATTSFSGEVYADPTAETFGALGFVSGFGSVVNAQSGKSVIEAFLKGFSMDWGLSIQRDTILKGAWQQGGLLVAGPGVDSVLYFHKDKQAGDEPDLAEVLAACRAASS